MIVFPNCKINLGLQITKKREDGYHDLETVFFPVPIKDILEIISSPAFEFTVSGITMDPTGNICIQAYNLLKQDFPSVPPVKMHLHKNIPLGAGLGGGSSDAAFTLLLLNEKYNLGLTIEQLIDYALRLGSDCPFFMINKPSFAEGRGEILQSLPVSLAGYKMVIVNPGIHISTRWAFSKIKPRTTVNSLSEIITQPVETWKSRLCNDFEDPVFDAHPEIATIKNELYQYGALYASLSGTGSTVYGIFKKNEIITGNWNNYFCRTIDL